MRDPDLCGASALAAQRTPLKSRSKEQSDVCSRVGKDSGSPS